MKIAVIIDAWFPIIGGSQTHVWELSSRLVKNYGCEIDIFTRALTGDSGNIYDQSEEYFNGQLRIIRVRPATKLANVWGRVSTIITIALKVIKENKNKNYDLIHAHSILGGLIGKIVKIFTKKPLLFTVHGALNMDRGIKNFDYFIEKWLLLKTKYDRVISVGKGYLKYNNINYNVHIVPNGVSLDSFDAIQDIGKADFFKILFVGRLHWQKGVDTLIESLNILKENNHPLLNEKKIQAHLVGYGFEIEKYKKLVAASGLEDIIFFKGKLTGKELIKEYKSSHLFVLPSVCEGQPITFLEAMASRLPILTTFSADNAEVIDSSIGWKIERKDASQLASKLIEIIKLPASKLDKMGKNSYEKVSKHYRWDIIAEKHFQIYSSLT